MGYLLFLLALIVLFMFMASSEFLENPHASLWDVFALDRYEWYRNLRKDVHNALAQLGRDWGRFCRFVERDVAWVVAAVSGTIGLILTALMMIAFSPTSVKSALVNTLKVERSLTRVDRGDLIETRTTLPDYVIAANDPSVFMEVAYNQYPIRRAGGEQVKRPGKIHNFTRLPERKPDELIVVIAKPVPGNPPEAGLLFDGSVKGTSNDSSVMATIGGLFVEKTYTKGAYRIFLENRAPSIIGRVRVEELIPPQFEVVNTVPLPELESDPDRRLWNVEQDEILRAGKDDELDHQDARVWIVDALEPGESQTILIQLDDRNPQRIQTRTRVIVRAEYAEAETVVEPEREPVPRPRAAPKRTAPKRQPEPEVVRSRPKQRRPPELSKQEREKIGRLRVDITGPRQVQLGDVIPWNFRIRNYGMETISDAKLRITLDDRVYHSAGEELLLKINTLGQGNTHNAKFKGKAVKPGRSVAKLEILFGDKVVQTGRQTLDVVKAK